MRDNWPETKITWIIGKVEHKLVGRLEGVEFLVFDKSQGVGAYLSAHRLLKGRRFDLLLHMQVALRANLLSALVKAPIKIGYDKARSKDLHGWFVNCRIDPQDSEHVVDCFFSFLKKAGLDCRTSSWQLPEIEEDLSLYHSVIAEAEPFAIISPNSSHALRNWGVEGYAEIADYLVEKYGMKVLLCGGRSPVEQQQASDIGAAMNCSAVNLVGKDTFPQFLAMLRRASVLITPDSGPAHMGAVADTPVVGLYAASNPLRSGPYNSVKWCVDQYDAAARRLFDTAGDRLKWGTKLEKPGVMALITPAMVKSKLDKLLAQPVLRSK